MLLLVHFLNYFLFEQYFLPIVSNLQQLVLPIVLPVVFSESCQLLVSIFFHLLHSNNHPFKLSNANILQHITFAGTWITFFLLLLQSSFRDKGYENLAEILVNSTIGFNIAVIATAIAILGLTLRSELKFLKNVVEIDINISKSLSTSIKGKLSKFTKMSKAHVKARHLEVEAEKARHAADQHGGNHGKRWNKLSLMSKLGGLSKSHRQPTGGVHDHEDAEEQADRLHRESVVHMKARRKSIAIQSVVGREKIMERLKLRAKAKKAKVMDKVDMFASLTQKSKTGLIMAMQQGDYSENQPLCKQGEDADRLFVLIEGTAKCLVVFDGAGEQEVSEFSFCW